MLLVWERRAAGAAALCCGRSCGLAAALAAAPGAAPAAAVNAQVVLAAARLAPADLVAQRLEGAAPHVLPYFIAVDAPQRAVVLAVRGSLSLDDVVRDLLWEPADLEGWLAEGAAGGKGGGPAVPLAPSARPAAHAGILQAARATLADVEAGGALESLLAPGGRAAGFRLVLCGHSLGAGVAFLMALRLRAGAFPAARAFAFSPPGGLATAELCAAAAPWATSVVVGSEWIPRLTAATFERLRDEVVHAAARARRPKAAVFAAWALNRAPPPEALLHASLDEISAEPCEWLARYRRSLAASAPARERVERAARFGPPGRVVFLRALAAADLAADAAAAAEGVSVRPKRGRRRRRREYRAEWADGGRLVDEGVVVSARMMADHMPGHALAVLERAAAAARGGAAAEI